MYVCTCVCLYIMCMRIPYTYIHTDIRAYRTVPCRAVPHHTVPYHTIPYHTTHALHTYMLTHFFPCRATSADADESNELRGWNQGEYYLKCVFPGKGARADRDRAVHEAWIRNGCRRTTAQTVAVFPATIPTIRQRWGGGRSKKRQNGERKRTEGQAGAVDLSEDSPSKLERCCAVQGAGSSVRLGPRRAAGILP